MVEKNNSVIQHCEAKTGNGELVKFTCNETDAETLVQALSKIRSINITTSHRVNVAHGSYGRYSRFDITQHCYAGGGGPGHGGFIEVLEIRDAPDNRCGNILHEDDCQNGAYFSEFQTIEEAKAAYEITWGSIRGHERLAKLSGFKRTIRCGELTPWFYAIGEQDLVGDYAFPEDFQGDPVYTFGKQFVVTEANDLEEITSVKTCMGARVYEVETPFNNWGQDRKKYTKRIVYWNDGSSTELDKVGKSYTPRPVKAGELWITDALKEFQALLAGKNTEFTINFTNGNKFIGKLIGKKKAEQASEGIYWAEALLKGDKIVKGNFDFVPSPETPTPLDLIKIKAVWGDRIDRVSIKKVKAAPKGKKWAGVFYSNNKTDNTPSV